MKKLSLLAAGLLLSAGLVTYAFTPGSDDPKKCDKKCCAPSSCDPAACDSTQNKISCVQVCKK